MQLRQALKASASTQDDMPHMKKNASVLETVFHFGGIGKA
jgi:hypothetical protein